jgi:hypothetical protein
LLPPSRHGTTIFHTIPPRWAVCPVSMLPVVRRPSSRPRRTARQPLGCFPHNTELYPYPAALHWAIGYGALLAFAWSKRADGRDHERRRTTTESTRERRKRMPKRWVESMKCNRWRNIIAILQI